MRRWVEATCASNPFLDLIRADYIGAYSATTEPLMVLVRAVLDRGMAVVAAIQTPNDVPRDDEIREESGPIYDAKSRKKDRP